MLTHPDIDPIAFSIGPLALRREPDAHPGYLAPGLTMGQSLSPPMMAAGLVVFWRAAGNVSRRSCCRDRAASRRVRK